MSVSRGASRLCHAIKLAITWPIRVKLEPFSTAEMERILAMSHMNHITSITSLNDNDIKMVSPRWKVDNARPIDNTHYDFCRYSRCTDLLSRSAFKVENVFTAFIRPFSFRALVVLNFFAMRICH